MKHKNDKCKSVQSSKTKFSQQYVYITPNNYLNFVILTAVISSKLKEQSSKGGKLLCTNSKKRKILP